MLAKLNLNEAIQVGPWRIARKHLLFVILFSLSIITFGIIILLTHVFDNEENEEEGEENENENDNENEENEEEEGGKRSWSSLNQKFSSGDWIVVAIMITAGLMAVAATMICFMVRKDAPRRLNSSHGNTSIYSVQFNNGDSKAPLPDQTTFACPQPLPLWQGHVQLPSTNTASQDAASQNPQSQHKPIQITVSNLPRASKQKTSSPSAPQIDGESPPPYSP